MVDTIEEDKNKEKTESRPDPDPKPEENLADKDITGFTPEQTAKHLEDLRYENAKRRIRAKDAKKAQQETQQALEKANKELEKANERLSSLEKAKQDEELKDASALEKERKKAEDLTSRILTLEADYQKTQIKLAEKDNKLKIKNREFTIERLMNRMGYKFSSSFERDGFLNSVTKMEDDGNFEMTDDEAILEVKKFVKETAPAPDTPGGGPPQRTSETPIANEIESLLAKDNLSDAENSRLDELLEQVG